MKIACYFNGKASFGGAERRIGRIMNGVAAKGITVEFVFTLFEPLENVEEAYKRVIGDDCNIHFVGFNTGREVFNYVKKSRFDIVFYVGAYRRMLPFFFGAKTCNSRTALLQVSTGPSIGMFNSLFERLEFELVARNSDYIDCLYPSTTSFFIKKYKKQKVSTTPCPATDISTFYPKEKEKIITFISRWVKGKNVELFVESILSIEEVLYKNGYKVYLCGSSQNGEVERNVKNQLEKAKHPEIFIIPGYINPEEVLPMSEVFMSLQNINNYPSQSLLEAIACGCFIVASDQGDTRLLVRPEYGTCCQLEAMEIGEKIIDYIKKDNNEKLKIIRNARTFAEKTFKLDDSIDHYMRIINDTLF